MKCIELLDLDETTESLACPMGNTIKYSSAETSADRTDPSGTTTKDTSDSSLKEALQRFKFHLPRSEVI